MKRLRAAGGPVHGVVAVPGSKSIANRALVIAALADGESALTNVPNGDDTTAMLRCLGALGIEIDATEQSVTVAGCNGVPRASATRLHAGLAGTTSRFVTAFAALADEPITVDGDPALRHRPMAPLHEALVTLGARIDYSDASGGLPVTVTGPLRGGETVQLRGDVSSQFVTALMLVAPVLDGGMHIELTTPLVSLPYVRLTAAVMMAFGAGAVEITERDVVVPAGRYCGTRFEVEADASSASYPLAIAAACGGEVTVPGLRRASLQGDIAVVDLLAAMGCDVVTHAGGVTVGRRPDRPVVGIDADMAATSDLVPTIAALAATATTPTVIRGVGFIRAKESDRLGDLAGELVKTGARLRETADGLRVEPVPGGAAALHGATMLTHHDHRLAMAFAVLGAAVDGVTVDDPDVVAKSWPAFWAAYDTLVGTR